MNRPKSPKTALAPTRAPGRNEGWRQANIGRLLNNALRRFESRVVELLKTAGHAEVTPAHINATRHLDVGGTRLTDMAQRAVMTKQSMSELVGQLEALGLVTRRADPADGRARLVHFTAEGLDWLDDFRRAVLKAEAEAATSMGEDTMRLIKEALSRYDAPG